MEYKDAEFEIIRFRADDVILTSDTQENTGGTDITLPRVPI